MDMGVSTSGLGILLRYCVEAGQDYNPEWSFPPIIAKSTENVGLLQRSLQGMV